MEFRGTGFWGTQVADRKLLASDTWVETRRGASQEREAKILLKEHVITRQRRVFQSNNKTHSRTLNKIKVLSRQRFI